MAIGEEKIKNAMDLNAAMAVEEIAEDMKISREEALVGFLSSNTGKILYDDSTKLWWDGPSAIAEAFKREMQYNKKYN